MTSKSQHDPYTSLIAPGGKVDPDLVRGLADTIALNNDINDNSVSPNNNNNNNNDDGAVSVCFKLTRDLNKRLDKYLQDRIPFMSRTQLQRLIKEEAVTVNNRIPKASTKLRLGDVIEVIVPPPPSNEIPAENIPLNILYEDNDIIVINKHAGIIVHPARANKSGTLINALAYHFLHRSTGSLSTVGEEQARPGVVHRLDKDTTGVIIAAKSDVAHWRLGKQFEKRTVDKRYLAVVCGKIEPVMDEIDLPIGKHPIHRELMAIRYDENSKPSKTVYRLREQYDGYALVELELLTGRTHQIRVHMAHLGWPLIGDDQYGGPLLNYSDIVPDIAATDTDFALMHKQALHATTICIKHPISGVSMSFTAPTYEDFKKLITLLRTYRSIDNSKILTPPGAVVDIESILN